MLAKRVIPCLDVHDGQVTRGVQFGKAEAGELRNVGDPVELALEYNEQGADEMVFFDITATAHERKTIVDVIERFRSVTTQPAITAIRAVVHGVFVAFCLVAALVLGSIGVFRLLDVVIPGESWSAHLVLGATLFTLGAWFWSRRTPRSRP